MKDTSPDVEQKYYERLMARSNEERFRMGISMCQSARKIVWASLSDDLNLTERRVQFFLRCYGREFDPDERARIVDHIRSHSPADPPLDASSESLIE
jgi:hypothetical protein